MVYNPMAEAELPEFFGKAEESELASDAVRENYAKGRDYAERGSDCAFRWSLGDAYMFYSLAERHLKTASRLAIRAADGDPIAALNNSPHVFKDLMLVQRVRASARELAGNMKQPLTELENTPGAPKLDDRL